MSCGHSAVVHQEAKRYVLRNALSVDFITQTSWSCFTDLDALSPSLHLVSPFKKEMRQAPAVCASSGGMTKHQIRQVIDETEQTPACFTALTPTCFTGVTNGSTGNLYLHKHGRHYRKSDPSMSDKSSNVSLAFPAHVARSSTKEHLLSSSEHLPSM